MFGSGVSQPGEGASVVGTTSLNQVMMDESDASPHGVGYTVPLGLGGEDGFDDILEAVVDVAKTGDAKTGRQIESR